MADDNLLDLGGQTAFVTGGGQGAGRAIALMLAKHNARVAVNDYVAERAEAVVGEIEALGGQAVATPCDVGDRDGVGRALAVAANRFGAVTLLVNNAGNAGPDKQIRLQPPFWESEPAEWDRFFRTNLHGVMNCCHAAMPAMIEAGHGRIITITSDAGRVGEARLAVYGAAKAGAAGFVRSLAREAGRHNITCNAISLSTLEPPMQGEKLEQFYAHEQVKKQLSRYVLRRFGKPDDVAAMALFLCSDAASWITGQTYPVNGGYSFSQ